MTKPFPISPRKSSRQQHRLLSRIVRQFPSWQDRPEHAAMVRRIRERIDGERTVTE